MRYQVSLHFDISGIDPEDWVYDAFGALRDAGLLEYVRGELEEDYTIEPLDEEAAGGESEPPTGPSLDGPGTNGEAS